MESIKKNGNPRFLDKVEIRRIVAEQNAKMEFIPDSTATAEKSQEMILALGVRPEDNIGSCGIIAARNES